MLLTFVDIQNAVPVINCYGLDLVKLSIADGTHAKKC